MSHAAETKALKAKLPANVFKALSKEWQRASAKGETKLSMAQFYKAKRIAQVDKMINSWMVA
jgi:hypothetical protein